jgi:hypothetical protein
MSGTGGGSETPDQAQTRRRWITLAEVVAVAGVIIAALTLYNNWQERRDAAADKAVEAASATRDKTRFVLRGTPSKDKSQIVLAKTEAHPSRPRSTSARRMPSIRRSNRAGSKRRCARRPMAAPTHRAAGCPC